MSSLTRRAKGYPDTKVKGKGRARYQDEPEDEVNLLSNADRDGFAEDESVAEAGRGHTGPSKPSVRSESPESFISLTYARLVTTGTSTDWKR